LIVPAFSRRRFIAVGAGAISGCASRPRQDRRVSAPRAVSIGVDSIDRAVPFLRDVLGHQLEWRRPIEPRRIKAWGLPGHTEGEVAEFSCGGYPTGRIRLLQLDPVATKVTRADFGPSAVDSPIAVGPKAIDFYAPASISDAIADWTRFGLTQRHPQPAVYPGGLEEAVFTGIGAAPMMAMGRPKGPSSDVRAGLPTDRYGEIATISIVTGDREASRRFFADVLGLTQRIDRPLPEGFRKPVETLVGAPPGLAIHWSMFGPTGENSAKFLLLHFTGQDSKMLASGMGPDRLGLAVFHFDVTGLDDLHDRLTAGGFEVTARPARVGGQRVMTARGPNGEFCEFSE
jgi:catechol 2,3-dioxygenase-like lactoylglutathione lyase family enzyme